MIPLINSFPVVVKPLTSFLSLIELASAFSEVTSRSNEGFPRKEVRGSNPSRSTKKLTS